MTIRDLARLIATVAAIVTEPIRDRLEPRP